MMKRSYSFLFLKQSLVLGLVFSFLLPAISEEVIDIESRRKSVQNLKQYITQRQARLELIRSDIESLDSRVEEGVSKIVEMLIEINDSEDSKVRVAKLKQDVIQRLHNSIEFYDRHRNQLTEELRHDTTAIPRETLQSDLAVFEERIEKRVEQIKSIVESMPEHQDVEKYKVTKTGSWRWRSYEVEEISEAWKQNRRGSQETDAMKEDLLKGLQESIDHLTSRNDYLAGKLKSETISAAERGLYQSDLERNTALIEVRKTQMSSVSSPDTPEAKSVSDDEAHDTELLIEGMVADIREDFFSIFRKYDELNKAREELKPLSDNLAARKQWLAEYDKENQ